MPPSATESDRTLSSTLIGGAFGLVGIAIFASASYADKVMTDALWWGNLSATISVIFFVLSIGFGGKGWTKGSGKGALNSFSLQALTGILGIAFLGTAAAVFAFNPKQELSTAEVMKIDQRLDALEKAVKKSQPQVVAPKPESKRAPEAP